MKINLYYHLASNTEWNIAAVFHGLQSRLKESYPGFQFNCVDSNLKWTSPEGHLGAGTKHGPQTMIVENATNKKHFVISYWDKLNDIIVSDNVYSALSPTRVSEPQNIGDRVSIFTSVGTHTDDCYFKPLKKEYIPISYLTMTGNIEKKIEHFYNQKNKREHLAKLTFRGRLYGFRQHLKSDIRFNVNSRKDASLDQDGYMDELNGSHLNFSINGSGEICHRDIEILGLGTALFRTKLVAKFHNELIPDYHYISVNFDDIKNEKYKPYSSEFYKALSDKIHDRFNEVKDDRDFIKFIGENGRKWYLENGTVISNVNIILKLLNLSRLE